MKFEEYKPKSYPTNLLQKDWTQRKCFIIDETSELIDKIHEMEVRDDDVWLVTVPKCGTTWMQELAWLVMHDFDFESAKNEDLELRSPFLELDYYLHGKIETALKPVENLTSPRLIKCHLPLPLLPEQLWEKKPKVIYVFRNLKDAAISSYYHGRNLGLHLNMTLPEYIEEYMDTMDRDILHSVEFYALRNESWIYYTSFECMKLNLRQVITDVCGFLGKSITENQMLDMLHHLSFEQMKDNPKTNHRWEFEQFRRSFNFNYESHNFLRKGKMNNYKEELSAETNSKLDDKLKELLKEHNVSLNELLLLDKQNDESE